MKNGILKILAIALVSIFLIYISVFFFSPSLIVDVYRGEDEESIWIKTKFFPFKKEISDTDSYKAPNIQWSPDKNHLAFYDFTREEILNKEWFLKIINPRILGIKTIFIGDYKTSEYEWIDKKTIRVYVSAGSGVRIYRDIDINIQEPFIATEHASPEYWIPEKTFAIESKEHGMIIGDKQFKFINPYPEIKSISVIGESSAVSDWQTKITVEYKDKIEEKKYAGFLDNAYLLNTVSFNRELFIVRQEGQNILTSVLVYSDKNKSLEEVKFFNKDKIRSNDLCCSYVIFKLFPNGVQYDLAVRSLSGDYETVYEYDFSDSSGNVFLEK